ncbi:MAG: hypothetical protein IT548_19370 [Alphaproteobacteria bacterium]|nr:hypothetical protein [Alphaproteobacteria bacterium]
MARGLAASGTAALLAWPAPGGAMEAGGPVPVITGTVDFGAAEGAEEFVGSQQLLQSLPSAPEVIYLDIAIAPTVVERSAAGIKLDFSTTGTAPDGAPLAGDLCKAGEWRAIPSGVGSLTLTPAKIDPHVVVRFDFTTIDAAPYNALSCDYAPAIPDLVVIHITGFFVVHETTIPGARSLRLIPFDPPYDVATAALAQSIAAP